MFSCALFVGWQDVHALFTLPNTHMNTHTPTYTCTYHFLLWSVCFEVDNFLSLFLSLSLCTHAPTQCLCNHPPVLHILMTGRFSSDNNSDNIPTLVEGTGHKRYFQDAEDLHAWAPTVAERGGTEPPPTKRPRGDRNSSGTESTASGGSTDTSLSFSTSEGASGNRSGSGSTGEEHPLHQHYSKAFQNRLVWSKSMLDLMEQAIANVMHMGEGGASSKKPS